MGQDLFAHPTVACVRVDTFVQEQPYLKRLLWHGRLQHPQRQQLRKALQQHARARQHQIALRHHLRPTSFMDNFATLFGQGIVADGAIALPAADGKTAFISAEDIGAVAAEALLGDTSGEAWTLTGAESLDHAEVAQILSDVLERPLRFINLSPEDCRQEIQAAYFVCGGVGWGGRVGRLSWPGPLASP